MEKTENLSSTSINGISQINSLISNLNWKFKINKRNKRLSPDFISILSENDKIEIYTDGSLVRLGEETKKSSAIFIDEDQKFSFTPECSNSSYGTELSAILVSLIISQKIDEVEIFTDSLSAIQAIENYPNKKCSEIFKMEDRNLLRNIDELIKQKVKKPKLNHVYSHLNEDKTKDKEFKILKMKEKYKEKTSEIISKNELADNLTKVINENEVKFNENDPGNDKLIILNEKEEIIRIPLKSIIKEKMLNKLWKEEITKINKSNIKFKDNSINWNYSRLIFDKKNSPKLQNFVQKLWLYNLETKSKMIGMMKSNKNKEDKKLRKNLKNKYKSVKCKFCDKYDNYVHFISECNKSIETHDKSKEEIENLLKEDKIDCKDLKWWFNNSNLNKIDERIFKLEMGDVGLIPNFLVELLETKGVKKLKEKLEKIQIIILSNLYNVWKNKL